MSPESKLHPRKLANSLLFQLENRGFMASGWAYGREDATPRYHKAAVMGSQLSVERIPAATRNLIMHTRLSTHGSEKDNRNNHPVLSPDKNIALVHNGVLWNHAEVKKTMPEFEFPEVDTAIAPALLQKFGVPGLAKASGDAAFAWFQTDTGRTLHLARQEHSPMVMIRLEDGSLLGASEAYMLGNVMKEISDAVAVDMYQMSELEYFQILDGQIISETELAEPVGFSKAFAGNYRAMTSGKATHLDDDPWGSYDGYDEAVDAWEDPDDDMWAYEMRKAMDASAKIYQTEAFYVTDYFNNEFVYNTLEELLERLNWYSKQEVTEPFWTSLDGPEAWINWFADIGEISYNGKHTSWLAFPEDMKDHGVPMAVIDGVDLLKRF